MPTVIARVEQPIKDALRALAEARGCRETDLLLAAVYKMTGVAPPTLSPHRAAAWTGAASAADAVSESIPLIDTELPSRRVRDDADTVRITIRIPSFVFKAAYKQSRARSTNGFAGWVTRLIQANILKSPVMRPAQMVELQRTNRELSAIGINLNQIARNLNLAPSEFERVRLEILEELGKRLEANRKAIHRLVEDEQQSWSVSDEPH